MRGYIIDQLRHAEIRQAIRKYSIGEKGGHYQSSSGQGIKQESDVIFIYGDIVNDSWWEEDVTPANVAEALASITGDSVTLRINSYGGETSAGLAIYNLVKDCGKTVTTIVDGFACSSGSIIAMAGSIRTMSIASLLMIHNAWMFTWGNAKELRKDADDLDTISNVAANTYRAVVSISNEKLLELLDAESWIAPDDALDMGFITEVAGALPDGDSDEDEEEDPPDDSGEQDPADDEDEGQEQEKKDEEPHEEALSNCQRLFGV